MAEPEVRVGKDPGEVAEIATSEVLSGLKASLLGRERASLALSGGSTPVPVYLRLAQVTEPPAWDRVDVFLADERCVPPDDAASNYRLIGETLIVGLGDRAPAVHRVRGELPPEEAAAAYSASLRDLLKGSPPVLDVVLLGVGGDGHTASIFPGTAAGGGQDREAWAVATRSPIPPRDRVSLSLAVLRAARLRIVLVTGASKGGVIRRILGPDPDPDLPATWLADAAGRTVWVLDEAAAGSVVA